MTQRRLLATTALEETWGSDEELVFLGEWCKRYERRHVWGERKHEVVPFHWDDREKLRRDYFYLETLHRAVLERIASALNSFHGVAHDLRYWQLLLDPWLLAYLSVSFDRWECVRVAFEAHGALDVCWVEDDHQMRPSFSYTEFVALAETDEWNQGFYQRLISHQFADRCRAVPSVPAAPRAPIGALPSTRRRRRMFGGAAYVLDRLIGAFRSRYDVAFVGSGFGVASLVRLNAALGQVPRYFLAQFGTAVGESDFPEDAARALDRSVLQVDVPGRTPFEEFVRRWITRDLPRSVVEQYGELNKRAKSLGVTAEVIVTAGSHWNNILAKFWFAEQVRDGARLVISEHGGSLPPFRELFGFEESIADVKATWFRPYHATHRQLPAAKLIGQPRRKRSRNRSGVAAGYCAVIGNECPRWVHRAHFYPMAHQWSLSFGMVLDFHSQLETPVAAHVRVKPYTSDQGWNTRARFEDALGSAKVLADRTLREVISEARVVVCTYPETTFAESMASGVPTVLMYPPRYYELNDVALPLVAKLRAAKILFHDATGAAAHVSEIWKGPERWWESKLVREAREEFDRQALDLDDNWCNRWTELLRGLAVPRTLGA